MNPHNHDWFFVKTIRPFWFLPHYNSIRIDECNCGALRSTMEDKSIVGEPNTINMDLVQEILKFDDSPLQGISVISRTWFEDVNTDEL